MATNFEEQVAALDEEKETVLSEVDEKYGGLIEESDSMFREQIDAVQSYADKQFEIQQAQTDFAVQQMEQQKDQLEKDYTKEQSAAYVDFKKQTDAHGVNAEKIAAGGMWGSGYSESAQTAMYTEYQRRVATAKASFDQAVVEFDNAMAQAQAQNNSVLAEIAFNALQQKLTLEMQMFTNRNSLLDAQASARAQVESNYLDVLEQLEENQYNTKPSMEDAFNDLKVKYPDGVVTDEMQWNELVSTYGEETLANAGFTRPEEAEESKLIGNKLIGVLQELVLAPLKNINTNLESVADLGRGPISPTELAKLIASGDVTVMQNPAGGVIFKNREKQENPFGAGSALTAPWKQPG